MFGIKKTIINSAIDYAFDFLEEKLKEFKDLVGDNDGDGQNDVDQLIDKVKVWAQVAKDLVDGVNVDTIISGAEQIMAGFTAITGAVDKQKLSSAFAILKADAKWLGNVVKASIVKFKEKNAKK